MNSTDGLSSGQTRRNVTLEKDVEEVENMLKWREMALQSSVYNEVIWSKGEWNSIVKGKTPEQRKSPYSEPSPGPFELETVY